uniref:Uncharacterized protein n=1 Tax=Vespula pensylvanica TaxID=30213 RepID=A0A834KRV7_VESPE|nr:hypothetical protein H0235_013333 [Vespula pensylvanica]
MARNSPAEDISGRVIILVGTLCTLIYAPTNSDIPRENRRIRANFGSQDFSVLFQRNLQVATTVSSLLSLPGRNLQEIRLIVSSGNNKREISNLFGFSGLPKGPRDINLTRSFCSDIFVLAREIAGKNSAICWEDVEPF